jgi:hypothetical protein
LQQEEEGGPDPEKQQLQQMVQQLQGVIQSKAAEKQAEAQAKGQIDLQKTQLQESAETQRHREDNETKLAVAELGAKMDRLALFLEERARLGVQGADQIAQHTDIQHEAVQNELDRQHEKELALQQHAQALQQGAQGHQQALEQGQQAGEQQMAQNEQQAALQPKAE